MPSLSRMRKWLFPIALVILIIASASVPVLQWLLPDNPLVAALSAAVAVISALTAGYDLLWDRWWAGRRKSVPRSAAPTGKHDYLDDLIRRLSTEQEQYMPLAGEQAPYEGYGADYTADGRTEILQEYQDIGEALADENHRRFVIIGDPGAGKTTTLRMLALAAARAHLTDGSERDKAIRDLYGDDRPVPLPLLVNLGLSENPPDAEQVLHTWWSKVEKLDGSVMDAVRNNQVWLFLDGLNEMPEIDASREERARSLRDLLQRAQFQDIRVVVTCRERDYAGDMRLDLPVVRVRPLDNPRIEAFANHRLKSAAPGFLAALDAQPHLRELGRNPYTLVRLIYVYNESKPLPETLEALHEQHTRLRYAHEEEHGRVIVPLPRLEKRLKRLAFRMIAAGKGTGADEAWAQWRIGRRALDDAFQLNLLVTDGRTGSFSFYHQTLHQYFALPGLSRRLSRGWPARRVRFIRQIADLGEGGTPAIPALTRAAQSFERIVVDEALTALFNMDRAAFKSAWQQTDYPILGLPPEQRAQWGRDIASIDKRPGVGLRDDGLPDIAWIPMKGTEAFEIRDYRNRIVGTFPVPDFQIAKYPVTYVQFQVFIDDPDGWDNLAWWRGLAADDDHKRTPGEQCFKYDNHPRENVSWYDAVAFCRWLDDRMQRVGAQHAAPLPEKFISGDWHIRLPTEWEWQWAAPGRDGREYPWDNKYISGYANINERWMGAGPHYLRTTTAVGIYPQGAAPCGALDMIGNVWEWCLNEYDNLFDVNIVSNNLRVVRGGSCHSDRGFARASVRKGYDPDRRYNDFGFRVCYGVPPSHERP